MFNHPKNVNICFYQSFKNQFGIPIRLVQDTSIKSVACHIHNNIPLSDPSMTEGFLLSAVNLEVTVYIFNVQSVFGPEEKSSLSLMIRNGVMNSLAIYWTWSFIMNRGLLKITEPIQNISPQDISFQNLSARKLIITKLIKLQNFSKQNVSITKLIQLQNVSNYKTYQTTKLINKIHESKFSNHGNVPYNFLKIREF